MELGDAQKENEWIQLAPGWIAAHPEACIGILWMKNTPNIPVCEELEQKKAMLEKELALRFPDRAALDSFSPMAAYEAYYKTYRKTYQVRKQIASVAAGERKIPTASVLVEAMFMAELKNGLLTAGHDVSALHFPMTLGAASGHESYEKINGQMQTVKEKDMIMSDRRGVIGSVIYGPDRRTMILPETEEAMFVIYGPAGVDKAQIYRHMEDIESYVRMALPEGRVKSAGVYSAAEYARKGQ